MKSQYALKLTRKDTIELLECIDALEAKIKDVHILYPDYPDKTLFLAENLDRFKSHLIEKLRTFENDLLVKLQQS